MFVEASVDLVVSGDPDVAVGTVGRCGPGRVRLLEVIVSCCVDAVGQLGHLFRDSFSSWTGSPGIFGESSEAAVVSVFVKGIRLA
jgi:hypothetical protein